MRTDWAVPGPRRWLRKRIITSWRRGRSRNATASWSRLFIVNVKDPRKPAFVKRVDPLLDLMEVPCNTGWADYYQDLVTDGDYLFIGNYGQIECYDIGDSENPRFVDQMHVGYQWSVGRKVGDYLYVPTLAGLRILEVPSTTQIPKGDIKLGYK